MTISSEAGFIYTTHGTATAGIVYADNGDYGVTGIAHNASEFILYPEWENDLPWDRIKAITRAVNDASSGDIIILEMQIEGALFGKYVMAEYDPLVWDLTKVASDKGVIVIAAAGNGGQNMDSDDYNDYNNRGNSGAIIVGATSDGTKHTTLNASNYGTRIDVNAWGANVYSTGYGDIQFGNDYHQYYTSNFLNTSAATAIIGGCVAVLQSYNFNLTGVYLNHVEMKELLALTGTPQSNNDYPVGNFPNLKAAIQEIDRRATLSTENESNLALITFFPNPVKDFLQLKQLDINSKKIIIYNTIGKKMLETQIDKKLNSIDISHLIKGVYFLKIMGNEQTLTKRIIKQ
jgi:subtilisin family serine protease